MRIKKDSFGIILLCNAIFFIVAAYLLPIRFETNDDVGMLLLASGKYTGTPDFHLVYINFIFGLIISSLYKITSQIEWYSVSFAIIHIFSLSFLLYYILKSESQRFCKICFSIFLYILEIRFIQNFQFTTTAALCTLSGIALVNKRDKKTWLLLGLFHIVLGTMIRFESAFLVLIIYVPQLLMESVASKKIIINKIHITFLCALGISMLLRFSDTYVYNIDKGYAYYRTCNKVLDNTIDNPNAYEIINTLPSNVMYDDYHLMLKFFIDASIFNEKTLNEIYSKITAIPLKNQSTHIISALRMYSHYLFYCAFIYVIILFSIAKNKRIVFTLSFLTFIGLLGFIALDGQIKQRVFFSASLPVLFIFFSEKISTNNKAIMGIVGLVILLFGVEEGISIYKTKSHRLIQEQKYQEQKCLINSFSKTHNEKIIPFYDALIYENENPFSVSSSNNYTQFCFLGWMAHHPFTLKQFNSFHDFQNNFVILISKRQTVNLSKITMCIKSHYNLELYPIVISENRDFQIYRFR